MEPPGEPATATPTSTSISTAISTATASSDAPTSERIAGISLVGAAELNPFDDQVWRSEGGSDSTADVAAAPPCPELPRAALDTAAAAPATTGDAAASAHADGAARSDSSDADVAPIAGGNPLREAIAAFARNKRNVAIGAGGALLLIFVIVLASRGGSTSNAQARATETADTVATSEAAPTEPAPIEPAPIEPAPIEAAPTEAAATEAAATEAAATEAAPTEPAPTEPAPTEAPPAEPAASTPSLTTTATASTARSTGAKARVPAARSKRIQSAPIKTAAADTAPTHAAPTHAAPTLAGKQIVLEYDTQVREGTTTANTPSADRAAISRARTSYAAGNTRRFAGDADGAILNYRQALAYYPAYVAAYRGLGLAYAKKGDRANAVKALRTYLRAAPNAKDASSIRKRLDTLATAN